MQRSPGQDEPPELRSEFRDIGGQRTLVTRKPSTTASLPAIEAGRSPQKSEKKPRRRQRTIMSELLAPNDASKVRSYMRGPPRGLDWVPPSAPVSDVLQVGGGQQPLGMPSRAIQKSQPGLPATPRKRSIQLRPKVIDSFVHAVGSRPRRVLVERVRQEHLSEDLVGILSSEYGISFETSDVDEGAWIPLDYFDNTEYDERTPQEWIALGYSEAQRQKQHFAAKGEDISDLPDYLALEALALDSNAGVGKWEECQVTTYDSASEKFGVMFSGQEERFAWLSKLWVMFVGAESPARHAKRVADA
ncbi:Dynein heavy chain 1, axonemal, partial [Perkinsus olseni]